jgi:hypothetical protein
MTHLALMMLAACAPPPSPAEVDSSPDVTVEPEESPPLETHDTAVPPEFGGWMLISELTTDTTLRDAHGTVVHHWEHTHPTATSVYLLPNGDILRAANPDTAELRFPRWSRAPGGAGGRLERWSWGGALRWSFELFSDKERLHHDITPLPNGNVLAILWEHRTTEEAVAAGRDPATIDADGIWTDSIVEIRPSGSDEGEVVWRWNAWDHIGAGPRQLNIQSGSMLPDWSHANGIRYNAELDQIILSVRGFSEIWVLDHSTTTEEAATANGGLRGHGGELLYRWGNPQMYGAGGPEDQVLWWQHDPRWVTESSLGAGNFTVFNNGAMFGVEQSGFVEWTPPLEKDGNYTLVDGRFLPDQPARAWVAPEAENFFNPFMSGAIKLKDGNMLLTGALTHSLIEVDPAGEVVSRFAPYEGLAEFERAFFKTELYDLDYPGVLDRLE